MSDTENRIEVVMLKRRIEELEHQINHIKSHMVNSAGRIQIMLDEDDYEGICEELEAWK